jgi:tRNA pseudouridine55 synthase
VVAIGKATRLLRFVEKTRKGYTGEVVLGTSTTTLDSAGDVVGTYDMSDVTIESARAVVAANLIGEIEQIPPMVSAIRVDGKRLHELAREGIEIERAPRPVTIHRFEILDWVEPGVLAVAVECSAGTYIRTLADDLGRMLGGGAHLRHLRRTHVGEFTLAESAPPDDCELLPVASAVRALPSVEVDDAVAALVANGRVLDRFEGSGPWAVFDASGDLLAVYEPFGDGQAKPAVVLPR